MADAPLQFDILSLVQSPEYQPLYATHFTIIFNVANNYDGADKFTIRELIYFSVNYG